MTEVHFIVEEAPEGGFVARAVGTDIYTEADSLEDLHDQVRDAVRGRQKPLEAKPLGHHRQAPGPEPEAYPEPGDGGRRHQPTLMSFSSDSSSMTARRSARSVSRST